MLGGAAAAAPSKVIAGRRARLNDLLHPAQTTTGTEWKHEGTPTFSFGPDGVETAHAVDERVSVQGLVDYCAALALIARRWCGVT